MASLMGKMEWTFQVSSENLNLILKGLRGALHKPEHREAAKRLCDELTNLKTKEVKNRLKENDKLIQNVRSARENSLTS